MEICNIFQSWYYFHRPERYFHKISYNLLEIPPVLNAINERRKILQSKIVELGYESKECERCNGACCLGNYDHFTLIDYLMRIFSDNPIKSYGTLWKPVKISSLIWENIRFSPISNPININRNSNNGCPNMTINGCKIEPQDRPIRCILWTCRAFRKSLHPKTLIEMGKLTKELGFISKEIINIFKRN